MVKSSYLSLLYPKSSEGIELTKRHKELLGHLVFITYKKLGKDIMDPNNQQVLLGLADILIEIYASESAILRAEKIGDDNHKQMAKFYQYESNQKIRRFASEIADELGGGFILKNIIKNTTRMVTVKPYSLSNEVADN